MSEARIAPRKLELGALVKLLVEEHETMREGLSKVSDLAEEKDFEGALKALKEVDQVFRQHIADEESQILRLLVAELGVKGAEREVRVFQQHRPIYLLMQQVAELASKTASELLDEHAKLTALFQQHTEAEESRVFPRALSCYEGGHVRRPSDG